MGFDEELLTRNEVMEIFKISAPTIYRWAKKDIKTY
ncbi:helix-turn-helix transcriptional regulator [Marinitoga lauensis]|nr:helix-turn-helix domain-containing protein [Marinitoga lauensis]